MTGSLGYCGTCGGWTFGNREHKCPPEWEVYDVEDSDEASAVRVHAYEGYRAAEKHAEDVYCASDYPEEQCIRARRVGETEWKVFRVRAEASVEFIAEEER